MTTSASAPLPASVLEALARYDTPTICNAMEIVAPERRLIGYTVKPLVCPFPTLPPIVGYARTVAIRSVLKSGLSAEEQSKRRIDYYEYVGTGFGPRISVIQDIDGPDVGYGAFWGEVQSAVHKALGCLGVITDGSIRDIPQWAPGFQALAGSIGAAVEIEAGDDAWQACFGEAPGGFICCGHATALAQLGERTKVTVIGKVGGDRLEIDLGSEKIELELEQLRERHRALESVFQ